MSKEFVIYADESDRKGELFSNFFGGVLVVSNGFVPKGQHFYNPQRKLGVVAARRRSTRPDATSAIKRGGTKMAAGSVTK